MRYAVTVTLVNSILMGGFALAGDLHLTASDLQAGFVEVGRREIARYDVPKEQRKQLPSPYKACLPLLKAPPEVLLKAIDWGIREGGIEERIGAMEVYQLAIDPVTKGIEKRPEYERLLVDLLNSDSFDSVAYTEVLIGTISMYHSRESIVAQIDAAGRTRNPEIREKLIESAADLLHLDFPIYYETPPLQKERILQDLEGWLNRNRDRIQFDKKGQPYLAGGQADELKTELTDADRERIRKDPVCVLKLMKSLVEGEEKGVLELNTRCGAALLGSEGANLLAGTANEASQEEPPSLDFQAAMSTAGVNYPTMDAVQLAIAYVAAYEKDPESHKLARDMLDEMGTEDMARVLRKEPREVKKKAKELGREVLEDDDD